MMYKGSIRIWIGEGAKDIVSIANTDLSYNRSKMKVKAGKDLIQIDVEAQDAVALVSSMSSMLKQMKVITNVKELTAGKKKMKE